MAQSKNNLPKKSLTNKPKIKNKRVNKLEFVETTHILYFYGIYIFTK